MTKLKDIEKLTIQLETILILLFRFRFLNRTQLQLLLHHKSKTKIILWLNGLTEKKYISRFYLKTVASDAAVYCLNTPSKKYLTKYCLKEVKASLLYRIYTERERSPIFRRHCMFVADIYLSLFSLCEKNNALLKFLTQNDLHGMKYLVNPHPDCYFSITEKSGSTKRYFLDVIDIYPIEDELVQRVHQYFGYYQKGFWQKNNANPFPEILLICAENRAKNFLTAVIKKRLKDDSPTFSLSTWADIKEKGITRSVLYTVIK